MLPAGILEPDADNDGMSDTWEKDKVVDDDPADTLGVIADVYSWDDYDHDGLTNIENYLDSLLQ